MISLAVSVLPAPDSPETRIDWLRRGRRRRFVPPFSAAAAAAAEDDEEEELPPPGASLRIARYAASATAYTCGLSSPSLAPMYCSIMCRP